MKCPKCQYESPDDAKFCIKCASPMEHRCPNCGAITPASGRFCKECAYDLRKPTEVPPIDFDQPQSYTPKFLADKILNIRSSIEGERKLVTVLFADVANYTSISEKLDPEEVHEIMDGCFQILMDEIHKYEGTINQFTGDGVMALFGAPIAHEDHAQRACLAALSVQKALNEYGTKLKEQKAVDFNLRIGLNSGEVVVGSIGNDLRMDYTAIGDTTNLAARMESIAEPGTINVSDLTHKLVSDFFEFKPLGGVQVKGKADPVVTFRLLKTSAVETRIEAAEARGLTFFVGREDETLFLKKALESSQSGSGQVVGVVGEAGVGKSRLLIEFKQTLAEDDYTFLEGRCFHYGISMAYLPILEMLRTYFQIEEDDEQAIIKKKMEQKIFQFDESSKSALAPVQDLLNIEIEDGAYLRLEPHQKKMRSFEAIKDLLVRESENQPIVLAVEDLHWIDRISEEFLSYLIDWIANTPILLIFLYRPEYTHQWGSKSYYTEVRVDQLSTTSSVQLVQNILQDGEVLPELSELILQRAGGNPLFVEELTHSLQDNGSIQKKNHQYILAPGASAVEIPETIQGIIAARIDRLEESLKHLMQVASVIGREFAFRILHTIIEMKEDLKSSLLNLQSLELIYEKRLFPELEYIFKHALTQEVAYNGLLHKLRKKIHGKIGNAIESLYSDRLDEYYELLAYHFGRSDNPDKAIDYLDLVNQKASGLSAMQEAITYFYEAMKILDTMPDTEINRQRQISLLVNQNYVFRLLMKFPEYYDLLKRYQPTADRLEHKELLGSFYSRIGHCQYTFGYLDEAIETITKAIEFCEADGNDEDIAMAYTVMAYPHYFKGNYEQVITLKEKAIGILEQHKRKAKDKTALGSNQVFLRAYNYAHAGASWAYLELGRWDEALKEAENELSFSKKYAMDGMVSHADTMIAYHYALKGDLDKAIEWGEIADQHAPTLQEKVWVQTVLGWVWCLTGETQKGIALLEKLVPLYQAAQQVSFGVWATVFLGEGYWLAGDYKKSKQTLEDCLSVTKRHGMIGYKGRIQRLLAENYLKTNLENAASYFEKSISIFKQVKAENELALAYAGYGRFHMQQGNVAKAKEYLTKALEIFERLGTLREPDKVKETLAQLTGP